MKHAEQIMSKNKKFFDLVYVALLSDFSSSHLHIQHRLQYQDAFYSLNLLSQLLHHTVHHVT